MVVFTFSVLDQKKLFGQIGLKTQRFLFKMNFATKTNLKMQSSMVASMLFALDWKYEYVEFNGDFFRLKIPFLG